MYKIEPSYVTIRKHRGAPAPGAPMVPTPMDEELIDFAPDGDEITADYAYIFVNSDGGEEIYYLAPESPLTSDDDGPSNSPAHPQPNTASVSTNVLPLDQPQVCKKSPSVARRRLAIWQGPQKLSFSTSL